jgi:hypothetical protein
LTARLEDVRVGQRQARDDQQQRERRDQRRKQLGDEPEEVAQSGV